MRYLQSRQKPKTRLVAVFSFHLWFSCESKCQKYISNSLFVAFCTVLQDRYIYQTITLNFQFIIGLETYPIFSILSFHVWYQRPCSLNWESFKSLAKKERRATLWSEAAFRGCLKQPQSSSAAFASRPPFESERQKTKKDEVFSRYFHCQTTSFFVHQIFAITNEMIFLGL